MTCLLSLLVLTHADHWGKLLPLSLAPCFIRTFPRDTSGSHLQRTCASSSPAFSTCGSSIQ